MQRPSNLSDQASLPRDRCGRCIHFNPRANGDAHQRQWGICAPAAGRKASACASTHRDNACALKPVQFKAKG